MLLVVGAIGCSTDVEYLRAGRGSDNTMPDAPFETTTIEPPDVASGVGGSQGTGGMGGEGGSSGGGGAGMFDAAADGGGGADGEQDGSFTDAATEVVPRDGAAVCEPGACLRVFVSSGYPAGSGNLGGTSAADAFCQSAADQARLGGTWKAWLSDTKSQPSTRFTKSTVPYRLLDGNVVANNWTSLLSGTLAHAINVSETGIAFTNGSVEVWTGTTTTGIYSGNSCADWTNDTQNPPNAEVGVSSQTNFGWTQAFVQFCNRTTIHLYCFEQ
jgi:hypothetical protein